MKSTIKKLAAFVGIAAIVGAMVGAALSSTTVTATVPEVIDLTPQKIEGLKADVVDRLSQCESGGHTEEYGLVTFDQNAAGTLSARNTPSFGILQFKVSTVQHYAKLQGHELTGKDAILLALDADEARALASYIIFETQGGIWNWQNCADKLGLGDEVTIIKKLTK